MTWPGVSRHAPRIFIGSHLDSVPNGGNFDGAAGVVAGLTVTAALRAVGVKPACDIVTTGVRAEESVWFQVSYIGSRSALGTLPEAALDARCVDTNCTIAEHMSASGAQSERLRRKERALDPLASAPFWKFISSKRQRWSNSAFLSQFAAAFRGIFVIRRCAFLGVTVTSARR